jgi:hypothetical protein
VASLFSRAVTREHRILEKTAHELHEAYCSKFPAVLSENLMTKIQMASKSSRTDFGGMLFVFGGNFIKADFILLFI